MFFKFFHLFRTTCFNINVCRMASSRLVISWDLYYLIQTSISSSNRRKPLLLLCKNSPLYEFAWWNKKLLISALQLLYTIECYHMFFSIRKQKFKLFLFTLRGHVWKFLAYTKQYFKRQLHNIIFIVDVYFIFVLKFNKRHFCTLYSGIM